jgi:hypothetical protein
MVLVDKDLAVEVKRQAREQSMLVYGAYNALIQYALDNGGLEVAIKMAKK